MTQKGIAPILIVLILAAIVLFTPIPYYQNENVICIQMVGVDCPQKGWHLDGNLWQLLTKRSMPSSDIEWFIKDEEGLGKRYPIPSPTRSFEGKFCGGFAANLPENQCPSGYKCQLDGDYPDADGKCVKD